MSGAIDFIFLVQVLIIAVIIASALLLIWEAKRNAKKAMDEKEDSHEGMRED